MVRITSADLKKLEQITRGGKYCTIYKKDDTTAYKIYHEEISCGGRVITNPVLTLTWLHFRTLLKRYKNLKYSGGITDLIYVDGEFRGVVTPYYDGVILKEKIHEPVKDKIRLAKDYVRDAKELDELLVYKTDHKLNNVMLVDGEVRLIDLDDLFNHACFFRNPFYRVYGISELGAAVQMFFKEDIRYPISRRVERALKRDNYFTAFNYQRIDKYIESKEKEKGILYIDENADPEYVRRLCLEQNLEIVVVLNEVKRLNFNLLRIINRFKEKGVEIYDFILKDKIDEYRSIENISQELLNANGDIKRLSKERKIFEPKKK